MTAQSEPSPLTDEAKARIYNWAAERVTIPHSSPAGDAAVLLLEQRDELAWLRTAQQALLDGGDALKQARDDALARLRLAEARLDGLIDICRDYLTDEDMDGFLRRYIALLGAPAGGE